MSRTRLLFLAAFLSTTSIQADDKTAYMSAEQPTFVLVDGVDVDAGILVYLKNVAKPVYETRTVSETIDGKVQQRPISVMRKVFETHALSRKLGDFRITTAGGKPVAGADLKTLTGKIVVLSSGSEAPALEFLAKLAAETVVLTNLRSEDEQANFGGPGIAPTAAPAPVPATGPIPVGPIRTFPRPAGAAPRP